TLSEGRQTRRRGAELEAAILDAAWEELAENGYSGLTFERVAARASTGRAVLYRRWSSREELVRAAVRRVGERTASVPIDTGNLRDDLIQTLRRSNDSRRGMWTILSIQLASFFEETQLTPGDLREELLGARGSSIEVVLSRAIERGE